jgi:hypothetical protein
MNGDITLGVTMAKYLTRRCIWLHAITVFLVSSFILAAWWQYGAARAGNGLSWAYTFEWPAFAVYVVYMWWKMIHDQRTGFDRLWAARQHAAADALGTPLHQIPGWALDKTLSRAVIAASLETPDSPALTVGATAPYVPPALGDGEGGQGSPMLRREGDSEAEIEIVDHPAVIDAKVTDVKVHVDEDLVAYNRYLAELNRRDAPKHWGLRRNGAHADADTDDIDPVPSTTESLCPRGELPASGQGES